MSVCVVVFNFYQISFSVLLGRDAPKKKDCSDAMSEIVYGRLIRNREDRVLCEE